MGYSWLRDGPYVAPTEVPYSDAMMTRPFEINFTGKRPFHRKASEFDVPKPPEAWLPYLRKYASPRLGAQDVSLVPNAETHGDSL